MTGHLPECKLLTDWHADPTIGMFFQTIRGYECAPGCDYFKRLCSPQANARAALRYLQYHGTTPWAIKGGTPCPPSDDSSAGGSA